MFSTCHEYSPVSSCKLPRKTFNNCIIRGNLPCILRYLDITPVFEKGDTAGKSNQSTCHIFSKAQSVKIFSRPPKKTSYPTCPSKND